jgi:kynureninase
VFDGLGLDVVRAKSLALTDLFMDLVEEWAGDIEVATPKEHERRGSQVSLRHDHAFPMVQALIARGVVGDFRIPDIARFGFAPLYVRYVDVWDAAVAIREVVASGEWRDPRFAARSTVT